MNRLFRLFAQACLIISPLGCSLSQAATTMSPAELRARVKENEMPNVSSAFVINLFFEKRTDLILTLFEVPAYHADICKDLVEEQESEFRDQLILLLMQQPWPESWQPSTVEESPPREASLIRACLRKLRIYLPDENLAEGNLESQQRLLQFPERKRLAEKLAVAYAAERATVRNPTDPKELAMRKHITEWSGIAWCGPTPETDFFVYSKLNEYGVAALPVLRELATAKTLPPRKRRGYMTNIGSYLNRFGDQVSAEEREKCIQLLMQVFKEHYWRPLTDEDRYHTRHALSALCDNFDPRMLALGKQWLAEQPSGVVWHYESHYESKIREMSQYPYTTARWNEISRGEINASSMWKRRLKFALEDHPWLWGVVGLLALGVLAIPIKLYFVIRKRFAKRVRG